MGRGLAQTGDLGAEDMARTLAALQDFKQVMATYGVKAYRAVGTQALRQARNRQVFLDRLRDSLGLAVQVLAPEEEARLSLQGVLSALDPKYLPGPVLIFDVGGGSSEFALVRPGQEPRFASLALGVLTLSQARPLGDPPAPEKVAALHEEITEKLSRFRDRVCPPDLTGAVRLVGTAGAVTTLAAMHLKLSPYDPNQVNNLVLSRPQLAATDRAHLPADGGGAGPIAGDRARQGRGHGSRGPDYPVHLGSLRPGLPGGHRRRPARGGFRKF